MIESTFFYAGLVAFLMMIVGLGCTVLEFSRLSQRQDEADLLNDNAESRSERHDSGVDRTHLKVVRAGQV